MTQEKLQELHNGFETAYIDEAVASNLALQAVPLTTNREWNTRIISTKKGEVAQEVIREFHVLWNSEYTLDYDDFYEKYKKQYQIIKKQYTEGLTI